MSEATLTFEQISSYSNLKNTLESFWSQGYEKVTFPELCVTLYGYGIVFFEIPPDGRPIKSPRQIDFNGWTIQVKNTIKSFGLFDLERRDAQGNAVNLKGIHITKSDIDAGDFRACPELANGRKLLIVKDEKEWTYRTDSNNQVSFPREDAILIVDGKAVNKPIAPYDTPSSAISYHYYDLDNDVPIRFSNLTFKRDVTSTFPTNLVFIQGYNDVLIENITIGFTDNSITGHTATGLDRCINVFNCSNVKLRDININGTYSASNTAGYGFYLQTVFNLSLYNVNGQAMWGVTNMFNINRMYLNHCTLNRLDIHCYGRDIRCYDCTFENTIINNPNKYNQFSSIFGTLYYESCIFKNFLPVLFESSYHAYSGFDLVIDSCVLDGYHTDNAIIKAGYIEDKADMRPEFQKTEWPNIHIINLKMININNVTQQTLFKLYSEPVNPSINTIGYITQATVSYGKWTDKDKIKYPTVTVDTSAVPSSQTFRFSNYTSYLAFDNTLTLKSSQTDIEDFINEMNNL